MLARCLVLCVLAALSLSCGPDGAREPGAATQAHGPEVVIGGQYDVSGVTVDKASGTQRPIQGRVVLVRRDDRYTSHFELSTLFPGMEATAARVVGAGEGTITGNVLEGTADTHLMIAGAPQVDVDFAFVPRQMGPRIVSTSTARFFPDGSVQIEIENQPAEGADYSPTSTTLVGYRTGDATSLAAEEDPGP